MSHAPGAATSARCFPARHQITTQCRLLRGVAGQAGGETQQQGALLGIHLGQVALQTAKFGSFFFGIAPEAFVVIADELAGLGRLVAFVHDFVERHVQGAGPLFESLDVGNGVAVLDARNVTAEKAGGFFDVALAEILFFAQGSESLSYFHNVRLQQGGGSWLVGNNEEWLASSE